VSTRMQRKWNSHTLLVGMSSGTEAMENSLAVRQKVDSHHMTQQFHSDAHTPQRKKWKHTSPQKLVQISIPSNIIHNSQSGNNPNAHLLKNGQKEYAYHGILFSHKNESSTHIHQNKHYTKWKTQGATYCMTSFIWHVQNK
jgi:hypothetical protein